MLETHARRIYTLGSRSSADAARNLAKKLQAGELGSRFDKRDVYRKEWTLVKTKEAVEAACGVLINNGWLKEMTVSVAGKTKQLYLHPLIFSSQQARKVSIEAR